MFLEHKGRYVKLDAITGAKYTAAVVDEKAQRDDPSQIVVYVSGAPPAEFFGAAADTVKSYLDENLRLE